MKRRSVKTVKIGKRDIRLDDLIGAICGVMIILLAIISAAAGASGSAAGAKDSEIPADAVTLTGTGAGRNGDITVEVIATADRIYRVTVTDQQETEGIGSVAVTKLPGEIYRAQSLKVDAVSGATLSSEGIRAAVINALENGGFDTAVFGASVVKADVVAQKVQTMSGVSVLHASDWKDQYPDIYNSWNMTSESDEIVDYLEQYPMLPTLYEPYGFAYCYGSARGHYYDVEDIKETGRPHALANCWTCKTPDFTNMVNEMGPEAYMLAWTDVEQHVVEGISCYNCHANEPGVLTVTHTYWIDALGDDFEKVDGANMVCGQCHNEYYFDPVTKETKIAHNSIASMDPETMLAFFNDPANFANGEAFTDYTNPRTGVKQIKVQHPEFETFLGEGSQHRAQYTCADCHMPVASAEDGSTYPSHNLISPLDVPELIEGECSKCHADLVSEVHAVQEKVEARTYSIGYELEFLTEMLADAVESGSLSEKKLDEVRTLARDAQFYWDFVFVENSEGAHNPELTYKCLDKAEELTNQALAILREK